MSNPTVTTNNHARDIVDAWQLTETEQKEFDYLNWEAIKEGDESAEFFRYRGELYDLGQFSRIIQVGSVRCHPMECDSPHFQGWQGYMSDSFFSGMLVKYANDGESVVVAIYCS